jgi:hypothetical protein
MHVGHNPCIGSVVFNGGPLICTVSGQTYTLNFNNLSFSLNVGQLASATGSLTINGQAVPANTQYLAYIFR